MNIFETIKQLRPHFFSLRELQGEKVSLDLRILSSWSHIEIISKYKIIELKNQNGGNEQLSIISLISENTEDGYNVLFDCANEIIRYNKELELRKILFEEKVKELKILFEKENIDKLKDFKILDNDGQETIDGVRLVEE